VKLVVMACQIWWLRSDWWCSGARVPFVAESWDTGRVPEVRYAFNGDVSLGYQVVGDGPTDVVVLMGWASNLDLQWQSPRLARFLTDLAVGHRLVLMDRRGAGVSERYWPTRVSSIEELTDDLAVVMESAGSRQAVLIGFHEAGLIAQLFAAAHPSRLLGLVLVDSFATVRESPDTPWQPPLEEFPPSRFRVSWGQALDREDARYLHPTEAAWLLQMQRGTSTPSARSAEVELWRHTNTISLLPTIRVPTLVLQDRDATAMSVAQNGRFLRERIPNATLIEHDGDDQLWWYAPADAIVREVRRFTASLDKHDPSLDRHLATVMFTDIVDSTAHAAALGDRSWRDIRERHDHIVRSQLARFHGREINTMGDGFLAIFDGPARAVRCAEEIVTSVRDLDIEIRAGLHTGEIEYDRDNITGIAIAISARLEALPQPSQILVSQTIKDLTAGAGLILTDYGERHLKGVPGPWRVYAVTTRSGGVAR
jgi:class 3 adenylate cyclase/alpha-beta hydrolase superfamily lysophospholipase